ncbi:hypothetical protein BAUCODRAFT_61200, partial [Baudoinia panamericana UAMH 10762]
VRITVGPPEEAKAFYVHKEVLSAQSPFFSAVLSKEWKEGAERVVDLPHDQPRVFEAYSVWLYTGHLYVLGEKHPENYGSIDYHHFIELYILGEKLLDRRFQNRVVDVIVAASIESPEVPGLITVNRAYEATPKGSPIRRLLCDIYVNGATMHWFRGYVSDAYPSAFLYDVAVLLLDTKHQAKLAAEGLVPAWYPSSPRRE